MTEEPLPDERLTALEMLVAALLARLSDDDADAIVADLSQRLSETATDPRSQLIVTRLTMIIGQTRDRARVLHHGLRAGSPKN